MNKQQILDEISKTKEHLINIEKMVGDCESERWKPKEGGKFFFVDAWSRSCYKDYRASSACCLEYYQTYNCFKTSEQAEAEAEKILIRRKLEDIARRLNKSEKIDWDNDLQSKYSISFDFYLGKIGILHSLQQKEQGVVYCVDKKFLDVAMQEIGEQRLMRYLKGEE